MEKFHSFAILSKLFMRTMGVSYRYCEPTLQVLQVCITAGTMGVPHGTAGAPYGYCTYLKQDGSFEIFTKTSFTTMNFCQITGYPTF